MKMRIEFTLIIYNEKPYIDIFGWLTYKDTDAHSNTCVHTHTHTNVRAYIYIYI